VQQAQDLEAIAAARLLAELRREAEVGDQCAAWLLALLTRGERAHGKAEADKPDKLST
jgi:hypothetical protein